MPLIERAGLQRRQANRIARVKIALASLPAHAAELYPPTCPAAWSSGAALARALALDPACCFWMNRRPGWIRSARRTSTNC